ncbi:hypothetical protein [Pusillimonas sp. ANT_WB101]|uniref:hypothetical protein n=1 Tax=Pusillimonas sp. ANT_WB101 TaxID=2597356 RepID=UPI0011ED32AC|nr:hypothetical protein [Pusillimonas sp. ANT_WB101]KAA0910633.1 hypothetical protein FQ179_01790 [Pusillimonas sp. ANT_WB101]
MTKETERADFEAWREQFKAEHGEWYYGDSDALRFQAWQAATTHTNKKMKKEWEGIIQVYVKRIEELVEQLERKQWGEPVGYLAPSTINWLSEPGRHPESNVGTTIYKAAKGLACVPIYAAPQPAEPVVKDSLTADAMPATQEEDEAWAELERRQARGPLTLGEAHKMLDQAARAGYAPVEYNANGEPTKWAFPKESQ